MQFMPYREPEWQKSLSALTNTVANQGANAVSSYYESKNRKQLEKKEKDRKELEQEKQAQAMSQILGWSPERSRAFVNAPPDAQKSLLKSMEERGLLGLAREGGMGAQGQMPQGAMPGMQQSPMDALQQLGQPQQQQMPPGALTMSNAGQSLRPEEPGSFLANRVLSGAAAGTPARSPEPQKPLSPEKQLDNEIREAVRNYDINNGLDMNPTNISGLMGAGMTKDEAKIVMTKAYNYEEKVQEEVKGVKEIKRIADRMNEITQSNIKSGGKLLRSPAEQEWLRSLEEGRSGYGGVGGTLGSALGGILGAVAGSMLPGGGTLAGAGVGAYAGKQAGEGLGKYFESSEIGRTKQGATKETQEYEKLSAELIKGAKAIFGSRITDNDLNAFMKMVPTLSNTDAGRLAILRNIKLVNEAGLVRGRVLNDVKKNNDGRLPGNVRDIVEEISAGIIDRMANEFRQENERMERLTREILGEPTKKSNSPVPFLPSGYNA